MALIQVGQRAPAFELLDQSGKKRHLRDFAGRTLVLYFFPGGATEGCKTEACQFRDHHPDFSKIKVAVMGVSPDSSETLRTFAQRHALDFPLLSDPADKGEPPEVCDRFGVWSEKTLFGRRYMGVMRTTYLIDAGGIVRARWDRVRISGHAAVVLREAKRLLVSNNRHGANGKLRKGVRDMNPPFNPVRGPRSAGGLPDGKPRRATTALPVVRLARAGRSPGLARGRPSPTAGGRR